MKPDVHISARTFATLTAYWVGRLTSTGLNCCRLDWVFQGEPALNFTKFPNNSHRLRPNFEAQLNSGLNSL